MVWSTLGMVWSIDSVMFRSWEVSGEAGDTETLLALALLDVSHTGGCRHILAIIDSLLHSARAAFVTGLKSTRANPSSMQRRSISGSEQDMTPIMTGLDPFLGKSLMACNNIQHALSPIRHPIKIKSYSLDAAALRQSSTLCTISQLKPRE